MTETLTTIETSSPGDRYTLLESPPRLAVHLAAPAAGGGTGPCICGFDRHQSGVGFSVGGGFTGPGIEHDVCAGCVAAREGRAVRGTHRDLFDPPRSNA